MILLALQNGLGVGAEAGCTHVCSCARETKWAHGLQNTSLQGLKV